MTDKGTEGETHEQYTWLCQGYWQWLILNSNIALASVQCLSYTNTRRFGKCFKTKTKMGVFNFQF
jgi:hypothetical protein